GAEPRPSGSGLLLMYFLQAPHADGVAQSRSHTFGGGARAAHGGDARDAVSDGAAPDGLFIGEGGRAGGGVDGELNGPALEQIDHVGTAFIHLEYGPANQPGTAER